MLIGYARVSTQEQNLELQINALKKVGCKKIFTEKASGAQRERPELKAALEYMRANEDTLVVWKFDRLARSLRQLIDTAEVLEKQGIGFKSLTENIDTTTPGGKLIFHIFGALAEFERGLIKERTIAGLKAAKDMGRTGGRPLSLNSNDLMIAKALLQNKNITVKEVARRLKVDPSTLYRYLPGGRSLIKEGSTILF
jgi:DNA invertase Pin-like site-specific DNA recombinase